MYTGKCHAVPLKFFNESNLIGLRSGEKQLAGKMRAGPSVCFGRAWAAFRRSQTIDKERLPQPMSHL